MKGETVLPTDESAPADDWEPIKSRDDLKPGHVYAIPPHGCVRSDAWVITEADDDSIIYQKSSGSGGREARFDEPLPTADSDDMPLEELIQWGHVYHRGEAETSDEDNTQPLSEFL